MKQFYDEKADTIHWGAVIGWLFAFVAVMVVLGIFGAIIHGAGSVASAPGRVLDNTMTTQSR